MCRNFKSGFLLKSYSVVFFKIGFFFCDFLGPFQRCPWYHSKMAAVPLNSSSNNTGQLTQVTSGSQTAEHSFLSNFHSATSLNAELGEDHFPTGKSSHQSLHLSSLAFSHNVPKSQCHNILMPRLQQSKGPDLHPMNGAYIGIFFPL